MSQGRKAVDISDYIDALYRFVEEELRRREAAGDLRRGEINSADVADAVIVWAYRQDFSVFPAEEILNRLRVMASSRIDAAVGRIQTRRGQIVDIDKDIPETPPAEEVSTLGEEILYFYEPDEELKLEDVLADVKTPTPEEAMELRELRNSFSAAVDALPRLWRRALRFKYAAGLTGPALAKALGRSEAEAQRIVETALAYIRQKLCDGGFASDDIGEATVSRL